LEKKLRKIKIVRKKRKKVDPKNVRKNILEAKNSKIVKEEKLKQFFERDASRSELAISKRNKLKKEVMIERR
jgi:hypothetical protein